MKDKKILVVGLGKEGVSAIKFLSSDNLVSVYDDKKEEELDPDFLSQLPTKIIRFFGNDPAGEYDVIVRSPGFPFDHPIIQKYSQADITSVIKIFFDLCPAPIIGVTGTKGKGTTSTLIYAILKKAGRDVYLGGNIGKSPLDFLADLKPESMVVLELSSFQLIDLQKSPHVGVVLMVTSEHLNWHTDQDDYVSAKSAIFANQNESDFAIINADYPNSQKIGEKAGGKKLFFSTNERVKGAYLDSEKIMFEGEEVAKVSDVLLSGRHNLQNVLAAVAVGKILNISNEDIVQVLQTFKGLEHRLELISEASGVRYFDDSFSTTPETTIAALDSFENSKIVVLGGSSKNSDFTELAKKINSLSTIKAIILIGDEGLTIKSAIEAVGGTDAKLIEGLEDMASIVKAAAEVATRGDVVLLSPACASFGMFKNYIDRGNQFKEEVQKLTY